MASLEVTITVLTTERLMIMMVLEMMSPLDFDGHGAAKSDDDATGDDAAADVDNELIKMLATKNYKK